MNGETFRPRWVSAALHHGDTARVGLVRWAFVVASLAHLWLADAWQLEWLPANVLYLLGLIVLCWRPAPVGWALCAVGLIYPLWFCRDQLTQSVVLFVIASSAASLLAWAGWRRDPIDRGRARQALLRITQGVCVVTYGLAALHKLNRDFFEPAWSCGVYGLDKLAAYYQLDGLTWPGWVLLAVPWAVVITEGSIAALHLAGRRRLSWLLAILFHIPLTVTMAPAFVFVMAVGHVAFVREVEIEGARRLLRRRWPWVVVGAMGLTAASLLAHGALPSWDMVAKEWALWGSALVVLGLIVRGRGGEGEEEGVEPLPGRWRLLVAAAVAAFLLNGLTPYLGVQYQHAGAMLSNLRIDEGCWNSLLFPESTRLTDDYVRIDAAWLARPGAIPEYEAILTERLWSPPQLRQMRRNWCRPEVRPIHLEGRFRGRAFHIDDLCDEAEALPFADDGVFGVEVFGDYLRFQKNLSRSCPGACIH